jgi:hypothetical protein
VAPATAGVVNVIVDPTHTGELLVITGKAGVGFTVIMVVAFEEHGPVVPTTVYVVVVVGFAVTTAPVVPLKPVEGDQLYVDAPDAASVVLLPEHKVNVVGVTFVIGVGFTVMVTVVDPLQPPLVPVTVYVVVLVGDAVTIDPVVPLNPEAGDHE